MNNKISGIMSLETSGKALEDVQSQETYRKYQHKSSFAGEDGLTDYG